MANDDPQRPDGVAAAFAPASVDASATPVATARSEGSEVSLAHGYNLFFYGTLIHPSILAKVIGNAGAHVTVQPAILPGYALHHVTNQDYPGLVPQSVSENIFEAHNKSRQESQTGPHSDPQDDDAQSTFPVVRGTLVCGLRHNEVRRLDAFEGDEYRRAGTRVLPNTDVLALPNDERPRDASIGQILSSLTPQRIAELVQVHSTSKEHVEGAGTFANVYLWDAPPLQTLDADIWTFEKFTASGKDRRWWS